MKNRSGLAVMRALGVVGFFSLVTAWLYRDVQGRFSERVLAGSTVGGFYSWLFWWWNYAFRNDLPFFHTAHLMFPVGGPLFPHSPVNEVFAVLLQGLLSPPESFNALLLLSYVFAGAGCYVLLHRLTKDAAASLLGSSLYAFSHYMIVQHGFGQVIEATIGFGPLLAWAYLRYREVPGRPALAVLLLAFCGVCFSGPYMAYAFGFIFPLGALVYGAVRAKGLFLIWRRKGVLGPLVGGLAVVSIAGLAVYWPLWKFAGLWHGGMNKSYVSLASLVDFPSWHRSPLIQALRAPWMAGYPEERMSYLGVAALSLLGAGIGKGLFRRNRAYRFWLWMFAWGILLSMGPWLKISHDISTPVPLPYALLQKLPLISEFRTVSRLWVIVTLCSSVLAALGFRELTSKWKRGWAALLAGGLLLVTYWEFDMGAIGQWHVSSLLPGVYRPIQNDADRFAILELPQSLTPRTAETPITGYLYMLYQTRHEKPMVLGSPSRYLVSSLEFTEATPFLYELTHPWTLSQLMTEPRLQPRREWLIRNGSRLLADQRIKYVVYHPSLVWFGRETAEPLEELLRQALGSPVLVDEEGNRLFITRPASSTERHQIGVPKAT